MADENATNPLTPGPLTSEHAAMESGSTWGRITTIVGLLIGGIPQIISLIQSTPLAETHAGANALTILGAVVAVTGIVKEALVKMSYIQGRSFLKAKALENSAS